MRELTYCGFFVVPSWPHPISLGIIDIEFDRFIDTEILVPRLRNGSVFQRQFAKTISYLGSANETPNAPDSDP